MSAKTRNASHYAQSLFRENPYLNIFWVDVQGSDLGRATRIDRFDQVFGEVGLQILGMDDLLSVLGVADRGAAFVEAMLHSLNNKSKSRWLVILDGVNTRLDVFFSGLGGAHPDNSRRRSPNSDQLYMDRYATPGTEDSI
ncbi:uncharacterized protein PG998_011765 [Apiospora kogelbergensis]|uniref:uncharacterized protein n=1 Tax=Apiospora kogelbergensis TaxID=1337665 RepID=UPI00312FA4E8